MVRLDGRRAVLMSVLKTGKASTIDIINSINEKLPQIRAIMPPELKIEALERSIGIRARGHFRRDTRSGDRRRADRLVDPAVPGQLAQHADHYHFDSLVDSGVDLLSVGAWAKPSTS